MSAQEKSGKRIVGRVLIGAGVLCLLLSIFFSLRNRTSLGTPLMAVTVVAVVAGIGMLLTGKPKM